MGFKISNEQIQLRDSMRAAFADTCPLSEIRGKFDGPVKVDGKIWKVCEELGIFPYFGESVDNGGGTGHELGLLAFEVGYALVHENILDTALTCWILNRLASPEDLKVAAANYGEELQLKIKAGKCRVALPPPLTNSSINKITCGTDRQIRYNGVMRFVSGLHHSEFVLAVESSAVILLDLRSGKEQVITQSEENCLDRTERRFSAELKNVSGLILPSVQPNKVALAQSAVKASELAGASRRLVELTVEHVKTRKQFDVPIGTFQAVQHKLADMEVQAAALQASANFACWSIEGSEDQLELSAKAALLYGCEVAPKIAETAIQLFGGIGFTWEHEAHFFLRRIRTIAALYGLNNQSTVEIISAV